MQTERPDYHGMRFGVAREEGSTEMIGPLVVLFVLVAWNLWDGELSPGEAAAAVGLYVGSLIVTSLMHLSPAVPVVTAALVDIVLIVKIFGGDLQIR